MSNVNDDAHLKLKRRLARAHLKFAFATASLTRSLLHDTFKLQSHAIVIPVC